MENEKATSPAGRYLREENSRKPSRRRKRRKQQPLVLAAAAAGILLLVVIVLCVCFRTDRFAGTWRYDEVTAYQFDGKVHGALILPDKEYPFSYEIADGKLSIDFESEAAKDATYDYSVSGNQLTLAGGEGNESVTYVLIK